MKQARWFIHPIFVFVLSTVALGISLLLYIYWYISVSENLKAVIQRYLATVDNLQTIGRSGTHRYNNMDHSMLTGIAAARRLLGQADDFNG